MNPVVFFKDLVRVELNNQVRSASSHQVVNKIAKHFVLLSFISRMIINVKYQYYDENHPRWYD